MKKADLEMLFRAKLSKAMRNKWRLTWHEDREIGPGVPDLSYVMVAPGQHQTGWLELKAIKDPGENPFKFKIEPSQHEWFNDHAGLIPAHFLVEVGSRSYLVGGAMHEMLDEPMCITQLEKWSMVSFNEYELSGLGLVLHELTKIN